VLRAAKGKEVIVKGWDKKGEETVTFRAGDYCLVSVGEETFYGTV